MSYLLSLFPDDPKLTAAIIGALASMCVMLISIPLRWYFEKTFLTFKLEEEYRYEQRKEVRRVLTRSKRRLLNSFEQLSHRLWNFSRTYRKNQHRSPTYADFSEDYYIHSFVYRLLAPYAWIKIIDEEIVHLDPSIAVRDDIYFLSELRLYSQLLCNCRLAEGYSDYKEDEERDHFFRNNLDNYAECLIEDCVVISFSEYEGRHTEMMEKLAPVYNFIADLSPEADNYKWDRVQLIHLFIIGFMNGHGYDYQKTDRSKIRDIVRGPGRGRFLANFIVILKRYVVDRRRNLKLIAQVIKESA